MVLRAGGRVELLGQGGLPVGLLPDATFERSETRLLPGDRLFLLSDGVTECPDLSGHELGEAGLVRLLAEHAGLGSEELMEALVWALHERMGGGDFRDDVSGVLFDYRP